MTVICKIQFSLQILTIFHLFSQYIKYGLGIISAVSRHHFRQETKNKNKKITTFFVTLLSVFIIQPRLPKMQLKHTLSI